MDMIFQSCRDGDRVLRHAQLCWWQDRPAETFLELYLFEQEIGHRTPKTGVLKLPVSDLAHLSAPNWDARAFGTWASHWRPVNRCSAGLSPAVVISFT